MDLYIANIKKFVLLLCSLVLSFQTHAADHSEDFLSEWQRTLHPNQSAKQIFRQRLQTRTTGEVCQQFLRCELA